MNEFYDVQLIGSTQHIYKHTLSLVLSFRDVLYYIISLLNLLNLYLPYIHKLLSIILILLLLLMQIGRMKQFLTTSSSSLIHPYARLAHVLSCTSSRPKQYSPHGGTSLHPRLHQPLFH